MKYEDLCPDPGSPQKLYCDKCRGYLVLIYETFDNVVEEIRIRVEGLPYLYCKNCKRKFLPDRSRYALVEIYEETARKEKTRTLRIRKKPGVRFPYYGKVDFIYDSDDFYYLPGLAMLHSEGFLTPVFFNKTVLIKFDNWPGYRIWLASNTYGSIRKGEEFHIDFGINPNGKVVMWLGDIADLPEEEQHYLRSENVESDHDLGSEFYDAQIEAQFTPRSLEGNLIEARSDMLESFSRRFGQRISHLDEETLRLIESFCRPVVFSEKEMKNAFDILNKIFVEALDSKALANILQKEGVDFNNLGRLKKLEIVLSHTFRDENVAEIMVPFFVLYDLRTKFSHLGSEEGKEKILLSVRARLRISEEEAGFDVLYEALVQKLADSCGTIKKLCDK